MINGLLSENVKLLKVSDAAIAATTAVTSAAVDMAADGGWDGCLFLTSFGTGAAGNLLKAQQSSDDGSADTYADLAGSEVNAGASDEDQYVDIYKPGERYLKAVATRGTSSTLENIWAILYRGHAPLPFDNVVSGTINGVALVSPDEGTA